MQRAHRLTTKSICLLAMVALSLIAIGLFPINAAQAAYPGRDGRIAFVRSNQIYTITAQGAGLTKLTTDAKNYWPKWSPDGKRIAYVHETAAGVRDVWVMNANGATKQRVTNTGTVSAPSWSADGKSLYFGSPLKRIKSTKPFGSPVTLTGFYDDPSDEALTLAVEPGRTVAVAPVGNKIAYYSNSFPDSPDHYLLVYNLTTRVITQLNNVGGSCCGEGFFADLDWSPDGKILGYTDGSYCPDCSDDPAPIPPPHIRFDLGTPFKDSHLYPNVAYDRQPAFSPTGRSLALVNNATGTQQIYVTNINGSGRRLLTQGYNPDWQPLK